MDSPALTAYRNRFGTAAKLLAKASGRINLIGEHTDYNDGFVLPTGVDRWVEIAAGQTDRTSEWTLVAENLGERVSLDELPGLPRGDFSDYLIGAARNLCQIAAMGGDPPPSESEVERRNRWFSESLEKSHRRPIPLPPSLRGLRTTIWGNIPVGGGLSSSAALTVAATRVLGTRMGPPLSSLEIARLAQHVENQFVGLKCGLMDPFVSATAAPNQALLLDCRHLTWEALNFPGDRAELLVLDTQKPRELSASSYNQRRNECERAAALLPPHERGRSSRPSLRDATPEQIARADSLLEPVLARRARHVVNENRRVLEAAQSLRDSRPERLGELMNESHDSLRDDFEVSCPELDFLVDEARSRAPVFGARMTGAGFGGCAIALVEKGQAHELIAPLAAAYGETFGHPGNFFVAKLDGESYCRAACS